MSTAKRSTYRTCPAEVQAALCALDTEILWQLLPAYGESNVSRIVEQGVAQRTTEITDVTIATLAMQCADTVRRLLRLGLHRLPEVR
jgi:hypothetical protein